MRILFMGTPEIAAASLERLCANGYNIIGAYTQPDKPKNRGMKLVESPVKQVAKKYNVPVYQPEKIKTPEALEELKALEPDIIAIVAYGKILTQAILDVPKYGCINIHGSILPQYRGPAPIQWSVINGDEYAGVTSMYVCEEMDSGDIIDVRKTKILPKETSGELFERLKHLGAELLCETIDKIENGTATRTVQDPALVTYAPMLSKEMSPIDWTKNTNEIINKIYGFIPWPVATTEVSGVALKVYGGDAAENPDNVTPGEIIALTKKGLIIATGDGAVCITEVQAPNGKRMKAPDYFRGHPIC